MIFRSFKSSPYVIFIVSSQPMQVGAGIEEKALADEFISSVGQLQSSGDISDFEAHHSLLSPFLLISILFFFYSC